MNGADFNKISNFFIKNSKHFVYLKINIIKTHGICNV